VYYTVVWSNAIALPRTLSFFPPPPTHRICSLFLTLDAGGGKVEEGRPELGTGLEGDKENGSDRLNKLPRILFSSSTLMNNPALHYKDGPKTRNFQTHISLKCSMNFIFNTDVGINKLYF
jgi:hypothetical protein